MSSKGVIAMNVFDLKKMPSYPHSQRGKNVFYQQDAFKARVIDLEAGGEMPTCQMESYVLFYVISGNAQVTVNHEIAELSEGHCLITEPATLSMKTKNGVRMMGIQITKR
jgi:quercetin dioxygenase-like cupin family protein